MADYNSRRYSVELLGRKSERQVLHHHWSSTNSKLIAIYGRRRVGKTYLVREHFSNRIFFEVAGLYDGNMADQLTHFTSSLAIHGYYPASLAKPSSWMAVFEMLALFIQEQKSKKKKVIFIDELPWFDTPRSKFLTAFENFWNSFCSKRKDILLIICGSAASWMIKKILKNKGGLHNRVAEQINLQPFDLALTKKFLQAKGIIWSVYDIAHTYMCLGGIPFYLDAARKGESPAQFINRICFTEEGVLFHEYNDLYASLFDNNERHEQIVALLAKKRKGYTRNEIIQLTGLDSGGTLTQTLDELKRSNFIQERIPYNGSMHNRRYRLIDNFTLFHFKFMTKDQRRVKDDWTKLSNSGRYRSWCGFAFESLCFAHKKQIKTALGLSAIESHIYEWNESTHKSEEGAQIDMIIDRADRVINVCEIKFYNSEFTISKSYAKVLRNKLASFQSVKRNKSKILFLTMITTFGTNQNKYSIELMQNQITLEDLFK